MFTLIKYDDVLDRICIHLEGLWTVFLSIKDKFNCVSINNMFCCRSFLLLYISILPTM